MTLENRREPSKLTEAAPKTELEDVEIVEKKERRKQPSKAQVSSSRRILGAKACWNEKKRLLFRFLWPVHKGSTDSGKTRVAQERLELATMGL